MARPTRYDSPGMWHHVMNRGVGKRTIFENRQDVRFFLSRLARSVRHGDIEVHAYCVMPNHFHLLVRSTRGRLSPAMAWIQDGFARYFNRTRNRVGSVFGGRFKSRVVASSIYWHTLVWYIDENPVRDGIVVHPAAYPWGSARHYNAPHGPPWLTREIVEATHYAHEEVLATRLLSPEQRDRMRRFIEMRLGAICDEVDPLDLLAAASSERVQEWIHNRALNADGFQAGIPLCTPNSVLEILNLGPHRPRPPVDMQSLAIWMLSTACGLGVVEIAARVRLSRTTVHRRLTDFRARVEGDPTWVGRVEGLLRECLSRDHPFQKVAELSLTQLGYNTAPTA